MSPATVAGVPPAGAAQLFKALGDETRLTIVRLLALTDLRSGELVARLSLPQNAVSYHLKHLRELGLLRDRRSHADGRDVYYHLDLDRLQALYQQAGQALSPALVPAGPAAGGADILGADPPLRVLFLCTHNSARSQLAEAILRLCGGDAVEVASAGDHPSVVHPMAIALMEQHGIDPRAHTAKSLDGLVGQAFDYVITVCDRANDRCPMFPDDPLRIHWSFPDPTAIDDETARTRAFATIWLELNTRVGHLLNLPHPTSGRRPGASSLAGVREPDMLEGAPRPGGATGRLGGLTGTLGGLTRKLGAPRERE